MEKLKMHSPNLTQDNIARIRDLFPGCVTEAKGEDGSVKLAVDFDQLRQELAESIVEGPQERYHLNWPGKREALLTANAPIAKTLRPCWNESVDFDNTKNLFIEGDNLDALKLMQETYLGKVKIIYIDPPYNTGSDFIYKDDFSEDAGEYLRRSNQKDDHGLRLIANPDTNGRYHSDWLSMIYPRVKLAWRLLTDDGLLFVSIDDNEAHNTQKLCSEIFGPGNFLGMLSWVKRTKPINSGDAKYQIQQRIEYVLVFCKGKNRANTYAFNLPVSERRVYNFDGKRGKCRLKDIEDSDIGGKKRDTMKFEILGVKPGEGKRWKIGAEEIERLIKLDRVRVIDGRVKIEIYAEDEEGVKYRPFWSSFGQEEVSSAEAGKAYLNELMGAMLGFDTVKPVNLISAILTFAPMERGDLVLDFFGGTSTTAEAVLQKNAEDGIDRRFVVVQLPEPCGPGSEAASAGFANIAEIGKERIRRAGKKVLQGQCHDDWGKDIGFRVLKVDTSNMAEVYYYPDELDKANLDLFVDNIKPDRTPEDLLFQVMLDWGVDLSLPITRETIQDKQVFFVDDDALAACFDTHSRIDEALVKELARRQPLRVVFRDAGFEGSAVKINVEQIFKLFSPSTEVKCI